MRLIHTTAATIAATGALMFALNQAPERGIDGIIVTSFVIGSIGLDRSKVWITNVDWSEYPELVAGWPEPELLVTSSELQTILYAGDYDFLVEESRLDEIGDGSEFTVDSRTGRPVIKEIGSIAQLIRCHPSGMLVAEERWWFRGGWGARIAPLFGEFGRSFEIRTGANLVAVRWSGGTADQSACTEIEAEIAY